MLNFERVRRISVTAHVKPPVLVAGKPVLTEAGVACQGNAGEQPQTVT